MTNPTRLIEWIISLLLAQTGKAVQRQLGEVGRGAQHGSLAVTSGFPLLLGSMVLRTNYGA